MHVLECNLVTTTDCFNWISLWAGFNLVKIQQSWTFNFFADCSPHKNEEYVSNISFLSALRIFQPAWKISNWALGSVILFVVTLALHWANLTWSEFWDLTVSLSLSFSFASFKICSPILKVFWYASSFFSKAFSFFINFLWHLCWIIFSLLVLLELFYSLPSPSLSSAWLHLLSPSSCISCISLLVLQELGKSCFYFLNSILYYTETIYTFLG